MSSKLHITVKSEDIDVNGHVNNAKYLEYLEWGRDAWYEQIGLPYDKLLKLGIQTVAVNININYRRECREGEQLSVHTVTQRIGRTSFVYLQEIKDREDNLRADALVTCVTIDAVKRSSVDLPEALRTALEKELSSLA